MDEPEMVRRLLHIFAVSQTYRKLTVDGETTVLGRTVHAEEMFKLQEIKGPLREGLKDNVGWLRVCMVVIVLFSLM